MQENGTTIAKMLSKSLKIEGSFRAFAKLALA
jgi:hypothetical protein